MTIHKRVKRTRRFRVSATLLQMLLIVLFCRMTTVYAGAFLEIMEAIGLPWTPPEWACNSFSYVAPEYCEGIRVSDGDEPVETDAQTWVRENCVEGETYRTSEELEQLEILAEFYFSTGNNLRYGPLKNLNWMNDCDPCGDNWKRIVCRGTRNHVSQILLPGLWPPLQGTLPANFSKLPELEFLFLHNNRFEGTIPEEWSQLDQLNIAYLHGNYLEGAMPPKVCDLRENNLDQLTADCEGNEAKVQCGYECCTGCMDDHIAPFFLMGDTGPLGLGLNVP